MQSMVVDDTRKKSAPDLREKETSRDRKGFFLIEELRPDFCEKIGYLTRDTVSESHNKMIKRVPPLREFAFSEAQEISFLESESSKGFIEQNNLESAYKRALELIKDFIPGVISIESDLAYDAEDDEDWVDILTTVTASGRDTAMADSALLREWLKEADHEETELLRLTYRFVS